MGIHVAPSKDNQPEQPGCRSSAHAALLSLGLADNQGEVQGRGTNSPDPFFFCKLALGLSTEWRGSG
jgi:hypothetical protein